MELYLGDCLEVMKDIETNTIDLLFCDLPYCGITNSKKDSEISCKWNTPIDLDLFWKQVNRICKEKTPMFFTCSTKFGVSLINSNPKNFRYDLVWVKSAPCGFLNAKKMPMKKHEMIYVFYKKLPLYDLSNHRHKFLKDNVVKEEYCEYDVNKNAYGGGKEGRIKISKNKEDHQQKYDPPLPTSVVRESTTNEVYESPKLTYNHKKRDEPLYDPPLPTSVVKEDTFIRGKNKSKQYVYKSEERVDNGKGWTYPSEYNSRKNGESAYDPPLPTSIVRETKNYKTLYGDVSIVKHPSTGSRWDPPLPTSILEVKSQKGKHSTQKPVALMEWVLKYYSKEGDVVLDPTMGSGSTGVACMGMKRHFIGIEMDEEIYKVAEERLKYKK